MRTGGTAGMLGH